MDNAFGSDTITDEAIQKLYKLKEINETIDNWWAETVFFVDDLIMMGFNIKEESFYI